MSLVSQAWPFVHPALAGFALAAGLAPILVHLINRRRYVRIPWAAMTFLLAANRRSVRRMRFEQWLLLIARVAVVILFGMAVARPFIPVSSVFPVRASRVHRVILIDNSLSMGAVVGGQTRFEAAHAHAGRLVDSFPSRDAVSIFTLADPAVAVVAQPVADRRFVRDRLTGIRATHRGTDIPGAMRLAEAMLAASDFPPGNVVIYVLSDFPERLWRAPASAEPTAAVAALRRLATKVAEPQRSIHLVPVSPGDTPNVGIVRVAADSALIGVDLPVRVAIEVRNFGAAAVRGAQLQVRREGQIVRREPLPRLEPGASTVTIVSCLFDRPGTHLVEARLSLSTPDVLREDDSRSVSLDVRQSIPVLIVDGRPGTTQLAGQAGFLAAALAPSGPGDETPFFQPRVIAEADLAAELATDVAIVALCNVPRLSPETWKRLESFVDGGGGLLVFAGDLLDPENYNRFGFAEGAGLLPGRFGRAIAMDAAGDELTFKPEGLIHPIVAEFTGEPESGLFSARVMRYLAMDRAGGQGEVVLRYSNDDAAMIASRFGRGRVVAFTTTANMDWTNLPARGDFVSLMLSTAAYLTPPAGAHRNLLVGGVVREPLSAAQSSLALRVSTADATSAEPSLVPGPEGLAIEYGPVERAGPLAVGVGPTSISYAVNVDPGESDVTSADLATLQTSVGASARVIGDIEALIELARGEAAARASELASAAMFAVLGLLLLEMWMAMRFGSGAVGDRGWFRSRRTASAPSHR